MAISTTIYAMKDYRASIGAETTAMTAKVTGMRNIPISGDITITENVSRRQDVQAGEGRTPKTADLKVNTKGQLKTISIPFYLDEALFMRFAENGFGKARASGPNYLRILSGHTPVSIESGGTFANWTGTMTLALINPKTSTTEILAGCVVNGLTFNSTKGTDGGLFNCTVELITQSEILTGQATPTGLTEYTLSDKTIGDFCSTSQVNHVLSGGTATKIADDEFSVVGDYTSYISVGDTIKLQIYNSGTGVYNNSSYEVGAISYALGITTITMIASSTLDFIEMFYYPTGKTDISLNAYTLSYNFKAKMVGQCADGNALTVAKNVPDVEVDYTLVYSVDDNTINNNQYARGNDIIEIYLSGETNYLISSLCCNPTADIIKTAVEDMAFWTLNARAFDNGVDTLHQIQLGVI